MTLRCHVALLLVAGLFAGCHPPPAETPPPSAGPVRIVSLAPSLTEIITTLTGTNNLVGRSRVCTFPAALVTNIPVAGDFGAPNLEALARLAPHIVVTVDSEDRNWARPLARLGIQHEKITCRTLDDIPRAICRLGELLRHEPAATELAGRIETELAALRAAPRPASPPRVFLEIWGDPLMTCGRDAFLSELVTLAGGDNIMNDVARDFFPVSPESVIARSPDVLILLEAADQPTALRLLASRPGWSQLAAVRAGRVVAGLDRNTLEIPGPRVLESVRILKECLERHR